MDCASLCFEKHELKASDRTPEGVKRPGWCCQHLLLQNLLCSFTSQASLFFLSLSGARSAEEKCVLLPKARSS